jgi:hypothetical protein
MSARLTIMMVQPGRNSWSELLTLGPSCRLWYAPQTASKVSCRHVTRTLENTSHAWLIVSHANEQSCTEPLSATCHRWHCLSENVALVAHSSHSFLSRIRTMRAFIAAWLRRSLKIAPHDGDFASQRMCPFCGLITPRHETCCLECGKSFRTA